MSLKSKTLSGMSWSFIDLISNGAILFVIGIVLARLLSPTDYGIVGLITVFIAVSQTIVDSGLSQALIRKQNCTEEDYNTMFYTNIVFGLVTFFLLFAAASLIARFYQKPELNLLTKIMAVNLIINSFGLIETTILTKTLNFKTQAKISVVSSITGGIVAITFAYLGFGYWSLAIKTLLTNLIKVFMLHYLSTWRPKLQYSLRSLKEMFGFGVKLLAASLINTIYANIYKAIIGKSFSLAELGLYTRAVQFRNLPATNITQTVQRVSYPVLASVSHNPQSVRSGYRKLIRLTSYITSLAMFGLLVCSREIILLLVGQQWAPAIPYLQIMCISGTLYPLHALNLNMLKAMDRSDLFLKVEIYKKVLVIPIIIIGIKLGMIILLWGMVFNSFMAYFINSLFSAKLIAYSSWAQLKDILPSLLENGIVMALAYLAGSLVAHNMYASLGVKIFVALVLVVGFGELGRLLEYKEIKGIIMEQIANTRLKALFGTQNNS